MAIVTKEIVTPVFDNTTMKKVYHDGVHKLFEIAPVDGYVLHNNVYDSYFDPELGEEVTEPILGFTRGISTCRYDYDFVVNPYEFYAVPENSVPENQIFGGDNNNDHEVK